LNSQCCVKGNYFGYNNTNILLIVRILTVIFCGDKILERICKEIVLRLKKVKYLLMSAVLMSIIINTAFVQNTKEILNGV